MNPDVEKYRVIRRSDLIDYKEISDYALVGDLRTSALIGIDGSIDWLCVPRFDSPSVFGAMLDARKAGRFRVCPAAEQFESWQFYEPLTNILVTLFRSGSAELRLTDFMTCFKIEDTYVSSGELLRMVECISGAMDVEVYCEPRFGYGAIVPNVTSVKQIGYSFFSSVPDNRQELGLLTSLDLYEKEKGTLTSTFGMKKGERVDLVLRSGGSRFHHSEDSHAETKLKETREFWIKWVERCRYSGKWRDQLLRSTLALKLLQYSPTGAIIAAPTSSLPEEIGGMRNWDYRYSWIRDSSFVLWAFHSLGYSEEAKMYTDWLTSVFCLTVGNLQPMLGVAGERDLSERTLDFLEGYKKSAPVRVGNGAWDQFQLDIYGILLDALYFSHKHGAGLQKKVYDYLIEPMIEALEHVWTKPDCGIWEVRSQKEHFVYSKVWAWVAVDRALKIARSMGISDHATQWTELRDRIKSEIFEKGYDESLGAFVRSYGSKELDAANLLMPQVRFISPKDPKMISTIDLTTKKLLSNGKFVYRYLAEDGLPGKEGAFLICSFWLVNCLTLAGRLQEAQEMLDSLLSCANHVGLFSEEVDPQSGKMLGNFPQAFTHMGFIVAASNLGKALESQSLEHAKLGKIL